MIYVLLFIITVYAIVLLAKKAKSKFFLWLACIIMVCVAGLRHGFIDTRAYRQGFVNMDISAVFDWTFFKETDNSSKGFALITATIKAFTNNSQVYLFILSLITIICLFWGIVKHIPNVELGIFLFVATGCYLGTMNGVRQYLAAAILFFFLPKWLEEKKPWKCLSLILLTSTIHASTLIFIPLYFVARLKVWGKGTWWLLIIGIFVGLFFNTGFGQIIAETLDGTTFERYENMLIAGDTSINIVRVFVNAVPLVLSFVLKENKEKQTPIYTVMFNMTVINFLVGIFATHMVYFYRLSAYFTPYMIVFLCMEIYAMPKENDKTLLYSATLIFYFIFFVFTMLSYGDTFFVGYLKY